MIRAGTYASAVEGIAPRFRLEKRLRMRAFRIRFVHSKLSCRGVRVVLKRPKILCRTPRSQRVEQVVRDAFSRTGVSVGRTPTRLAAPSQ